MAGGKLKPRTQLARRLRRDSTEAEKQLWQALRTLKLPWRVRRQHPIGPYIADFAIPARGLVIELDGGQHAVAVGRDEARSAELEQHGYRVLRFWNNDVLGNLEGVVQVIVGELGAAPPPPTPPPQGAEG